MPTDWRSAFARVKGALLRRGRTEDDADDLLQEAWVRLASYARDRPVERPEAFLMQVALNLSIDLHRARQTRGDEVLLEDVVLVDVTPSVEAVLLARERAARLSVCLGRLTDKTRDILLAHRIEDLTYAEIAQRHNLSVSSVERHISKAMLQLTTWMQGW